MTAKEWLEAVRRVDDEVVVLRRCMIDAYIQTTRTTANITGTRTQRSQDPHKFDNITILDNAVYNRVQVLNAMKAQAITMISRLADARQRQVLIAYYVDSRTADGRKKTWETVCEELNYSWSRLMEIRSAAISSLDTIHDVNGF